MNASERARLQAAMIRFADGDRAAFREVFDGLWPACLVLAMRLIAPPADAEDAAQRAILKVFDRIVDLDRERDGVAWAMTITAYEVLTIRKQRMRRREAASEAEREDDAPLASDILAERELFASVRELIGEMSERDREALATLLSGVTPRDERRESVASVRSSGCAPHGGKRMVDVESLAERARRVAARSRLRMACRIALVIVPLACVPLAGGADAGACACLGLALLVVAVWCRWRDRTGMDAVSAGLCIGAVPLAVALGLGACGVRCAQLGSVTEAELACLAAGAVAGIAASLVVARAPQDRRRRWLLTILVASLTAALGCVGLGAAGVLSTLIALIAGALVVWVPVAARAS